MKKEKQLEFNIKGISNQKELNKRHEEIHKDATSKLKVLLTQIIGNKQFTKEDIKQIISLSKWITEK
uniref:Uncharacterized protein n=1 Tax=viral metagenome TaxID=1070528 RepID=A0A6M3JJ76_9ZZZZ